MDVLYSADGLSAAEVRERIPDPPGYSAVRALLRILEEKGHVSHEERGPRYVYMPVVPREEARRSALNALVDTFFGGSPEQAVAALLDVSRERLSEQELARLSTLIDSARQVGR